MPELKLTYYPDITQHRKPAAVRSAIDEFAAALAAELSEVRSESWQVRVLDVVSVAEQTSMLAHGTCEIALAKPSSYVIAHRRNPRVQPAAVALRTIDDQEGDTYFAQLYTNVNSGILNMSDLQDACRRERDERPSIGFGDSFSTSNFLVPAAMLVDAGLHPLTRFRRVEFLGGHDGVAEAVYKGEVDVGAGHDGVIVDLARQPGMAEATQRLRQIERRDIHSDPVAVNVDDDLRTALTTALVNIGKDPAVKQNLDLFWGAVSGLGPTADDKYKSIKDAIDSLHLSEDDILGV